MTDTISSIIFYLILFAGIYFQVFILATLIEQKTDEEVPEKEKETFFPSVSITIPCFNEAQTLRKTVLSLLSLDYPKEKLNIIVIDDGSTDDTPKVAAEIVREFPQVSWFRQNNGGKFSALNFGLTQSKSELVGCLDADSFVDPYALKHIVTHFKNKEVMAVTPAIRVHNPSNIVQLIQKAEYNIGIFLKHMLGHINAIHVTPGPFSIFRRQVFETIGNYRHAHSTEDMEIAFRMHTHHFTIKNCPEARVYTVAPSTVKKLYRQRVRWIYGFLKNAIDYKFLFLNKKYGNLGLFTLPFSLLFIFTSLYIIGHAVYSTIHGIIQKIVEIQTIGITFNFHPFTFNWFFINTESITFLALVLVGTSIYFMLQGKKMAEGTMRPSREVIYFILLYGFIAPLWLSKAVYNTLLSKNTPWR